MGHGSKPPAQPADPYAQQMAQIGAEMWSGGGKQSFAEWSNEIRKRLEEQHYFKRMMGQVEKAYGDVGGQTRSALGGRYQYGSGYEGQAAKNLELSKASARAGAWQAGEEARQAGLQNLIGLASGQAMTGLGGASQSAQNLTQMASQREMARMQGISGVCCFNFIEADGEIADNVKLIRDAQYLGTLVEHGYKVMARWLVPLMRKNKIAKFLAKWLMTKPITAIANCHYGENNYGWLFVPIGYGWKWVWSLIGKYSKASEYTWEEFDGLPKYLS